MRIELKGEGSVRQIKEKGLWSSLKEINIIDETMKK